MLSYTIKKVPDSILRKKAEKVRTVGAAERQELAGMAEAMYLNQGVGLAALQVGIDKQLAVVDVGRGLLKIVNPVISKRAGFQTQEEGCLSVPGVVVKVKRAERIDVCFLNENGEIVGLTADGLLARAIQHEMDHLSGILIIDHLNPVKRLLLKTRLRPLSSPL